MIAISQEVARMTMTVLLSAGFLFALAFGRDQIVNGVKFMFLKKRGYTYFAFLTPSGKVEEAVLKVDKKLEWHGGTYFYNPKFSYKYDTGGNMYIENHPHPINLSKLYANPEQIELSQDSKSLTSILKRVYNLGKLSQTVAQKIESVLIYLLAGGFGISIWLLFQSDGKLDTLITLVSKLVGG